MKNQPIFWSKIVITLSLSLVIWILLLWEHFSGGVASHHILASEDMPSISNWWGGLVLPLLTWFSLHRIDKRIDEPETGSSAIEYYPKSVLLGFSGALCFGILISIFFSFGNTDVPRYMLLALLPTALFIPIYRSEFLLGFVLGMTYTFGVVIPALIGLLLALLSAGLYHLVRPIILKIGFRVFSSKNTPV